MVAVYLALVNLPVHVRMNIDNLQLVLLCRETDLNHFGAEVVFSKLITDLQDMECNGLVVGSERIDVRLVAVLGDNLGSHWLGGFCTNFSSNQFVCRYV
jgi:hypothetical protein